MMDGLHGTDMRLAAAVGTLARLSGDIRGCLDRLERLGYRAVQIDATFPATRPRELSKQARRDLAGFCRRREIEIAGLDAFIPVKHFLNKAYVDQAMAATLAALEMAADLGHLPVSLGLPAPLLEQDGGLVGELINQADRTGARLAIHLEEQPDLLASFLERCDHPGIGAGFSPAHALAAGNDPMVAMGRLGRHVLVGRLCDLSTSVAGSGVRCTLGEGDLDVATYRLGLDMAEQRIGPVILDLDGLSDPWRGAEVAPKVWRQAAPVI
ncbi:MAG: TIM barrel protein [Phycisphaeraceae bacterium]|nr:TIM barrel protein [Phycisphaeraceae bacterium]